MEKHKDEPGVTGISITDKGVLRVTDVRITDGNGDLVVKFTREQALSLGLLSCECGYPENNHFDWGLRLCAHNDKCSGYREVLKVGATIPTPWRV